MEEYLLEMKNIHKRFPGVYALKGVDLTLKAGEVMALVGENGAGKSTIINILGGIYTRDEGEILIDGKDAGIHGIQDAKAAGINIIHQELVLVPYLSVAENIFLNLFCSYPELKPSGQKLKLSEYVLFCTDGQ